MSGRAKGLTIISVTTLVIDTYVIYMYHRALYLPSPTGRGGSKGRKIFCIYVSINSSREIDQTFIYSVFQDTSPRHYI